MNLLNNNKGQSIIYWFFSIITFVIIWIMFLGKHISRIGLQGVADNNLTGFYAFVLSNLNLFIGAFLLLVILIIVNFGSVNQ